MNTLYYKQTYKDRLRTVSKRCTPNDFWEQTERKWLPIQPASKHDVTGRNSEPRYEWIGGDYNWKGVKEKMKRWRRNSEVCWIKSEVNFWSRRNNNAKSL